MVQASRNANKNIGGKKINKRQLILALLNYANHKKIKEYLMMGNVGQLGQSALQGADPTLELDLCFFTHV